MSVKCVCRRHESFLVANLILHFVEAGRQVQVSVWFGKCPVDEGENCHQQSVETTEVSDGGNQFCSYSFLSALCVGLNYLSDKDGPLDIFELVKILVARNIIKISEDLVIILS